MLSLFCALGIEQWPKWTNACLTEFTFKWRKTTNKQTYACICILIDRQMYIPYGGNYYEDKENMVRSWRVWGQVVGMCRQKGRLSFYRVIQGGLAGLNRKEWGKSSAIWEVQQAQSPETEVCLLCSRDSRVLCGWSDVIKGRVVTGAGRAVAGGRSRGL